MTEQKNFPSHNASFISLFFFLVLLVTAGCFCYYSAGKRIVKEVKSRELKAISALKTEQLNEWRKERENDACNLASDQVVHEFINNLADSAGKSF
jgi:Flp pilus assembly protein TadB